MTDSKLLATAQAHFDIVGHLDTFWSKEALTAWSAALQEKEAAEAERDDFKKEVDLHIKDLGELQGHFADCRQERGALEAERDRLVETARAVIAYDMPAIGGRPSQHWLDLMNATDCVAAPTPSGAPGVSTLQTVLADAIKEVEAWPDGMKGNWAPARYEFTDREAQPAQQGEGKPPSEACSWRDVAEHTMIHCDACGQRSGARSLLAARCPKGKRYSPPKPLQGGERYKPFKLVMHGGLDVVWIVTDRGVHMTSPQAAQRIAAALNREGS